MKTPMLPWKDMSTAPRDGTSIYGMIFEVGRVEPPLKIHWKSERWWSEDGSMGFKDTAFAKWAEIPEPELSRDQLERVAKLYRTIVGGSRHPVWTRMPVY